MCDEMSNEVKQPQVTATTVYYYCALTQVCSTNGSLAGRLAAIQ